MTDFSNLWPQSSWRIPLEKPVWRAGAEQFLDKLRGDLNSPLLRCSPAEHLQFLELVETTVTVRRPPDFQDFPELSVRIRGAIGRILQQMGPPVGHRRDYGCRPRAWDVVFESLGRDSEGEEFQKPLIIQVDSDASALRITARLVGMAGFWLPDVEAALVGALEGGVALSEDSKSRISLEIIEVSRRSRGYLDPPAYPVRSAHLRFLTPFRLRSENHNVFNGSSMLLSIANRVAKLARWQGVALVIPWAELHEKAHAITCNADDSYSYRWRRGSQRAQGRIAVVGALGSVELTGFIDPFVPFLQMGELVNGGSHAALGLGRYRAALYP